jgi:E3 Ubiquitin ligase
MTVLSIFFSGNSFWLVLLAFACACAGIYIFYIGFRMLRFKRMILNTPLSKIHSASIGLVEVNGTPVGPHVLTAPITGDPCYYYRVQAWQRVESDGKKKWIPVLDESLCVPFFLDDGTGRVLVDPQSAHMDVHRNFSDEVSASALLSPNLVPEHLRNFLATRGLVPSEKIKLDERIIPQGFPLFVFGTLGENTTMNASVPRPQICGASPLSYSFHPGGGTLMLRMSSKRALNADKVLAFANALGRVPAVHVETRVTRMGTPVDAFSQGTQASIRATVSVATAALPEQPSASSAPADRSTETTESAEFDLHPSVCIGKGERNELFTISARSQREVAGKLAWQSAACIWGGPVLALISFYFLKIYFEWLP